MSGREINTEESRLFKLTVELTDEQTKADVTTGGGIPSPLQRKAAMFDLCLGAYINPRNRAVVPSSSCRLFVQLTFVRPVVVRSCSFFRLLRSLCWISVLWKSVVRSSGCCATYAVRVWNWI